MEAPLRFDVDASLEAFAYADDSGLPPTSRPAWPGRRAAPQQARATRVDLVPVLRAVGAGDAEAFAQLYRLTAASLFGVALRIARRDATAEEIVQDAFASVWLNAARYDPNLAAPFTWLVAIVRHRALDVLRHTRFEAEPDADHDYLDRMEHVACDTPTPDELTHTRHAAAQLRRCLQRLNSNQQRALALAFFEDKSHAEVAIAMAVPVGTAKTWIRRGLIELRHAMLDTESAPR